MRHLRGNYILSLNKPKTTSYGLSSFFYVSAKMRNALPDFIRTTEFTGFKVENLRTHFVQRLFFFNNISLKIIYLVMYLYMICILVVNVMSRRHWLCSYSEIRDKTKFMHVSMLPSAGRVRAVCNLRLQCLPYDR